MRSIAAVASWAEIEFPSFATDEANRWLAHRDVAVRVARHTPLAELFALAAGRPVTEPARMGFAA